MTGCTRAIRRKDEFPCDLGHPSRGRVGVGAEDRNAPTGLLHDVEHVQGRKVQAAQRITDTAGVLSTRGQDQTPTGRGVGRFLLTCPGSTDYFWQMRATIAPTGGLARESMDVRTLSAFVAAFRDVLIP